MELLKVSALPIVDLNLITVPHPGLCVGDTEFCRKRFHKDHRCHDHYQQLSTSSLPDGKPTQCPFGLTSVPFRVGDMHLAITGIIPFPRMGGVEERTVAKTNPQLKIAVEGIRIAKEMVREASIRFSQIEAEIANQQAMALHEIRKLNRTVKQNAERMCLNASPSDPYGAPEEMIAIWKAAELMSSQFDVLELLANEDLVNLPRTSISEPYRIFDKLVRIFRRTTTECRIDIRSAMGFYPQVRVCDKTFPILASVLIENAIKYCDRNWPIDVSLNPVEPDRTLVRIEVTNVATNSDELDEQIFRKGVRAASDNDGTGKGLYLAQLVAKQHGSRIHFFKERLQGQKNLVRCHFRLDLELHSG